MDLSFLKRFQDQDDDENDENDANDDSDNGMEVDSNPLMDADGFNDDFGQDDPFGDQDDQDDGAGQGDLNDGQDQEKVEDAFEDLDEQIAIQRAGLGAESNFAVDSEEILIKGHPDMYSYFDSALLRNWAGPDHWKLRRIAKGRRMVQRCSSKDSMSLFLTGLILALSQTKRERQRREWLQGTELHRPRMKPADQRSDQERRNCSLTLWTHQRWMRMSCLRPLIQRPSCSQRPMRPRTESRSMFCLMISTFRPNNCCACS